MSSLRHPYLIAALVILIGSVIIFFTQPKREDCDSAKEHFRQKLASELYGQKRGNIPLPPLLVGAIQNCRLGNNSGACLHVMELTRKVLDQIQRVSEECIFVLQEERELHNALKQIATLWIEIAWGESYPELGNFCGDGCWFEASDFAFFCHLKNTYVRFFGNEAWLQMEPQMVANLPYDAPKWENNQCTNCESGRRKAIEVAGFHEVKQRSLLGYNCQRY